MGDGSLSKPVRKSDESARFRMGHGAKQAAYLDWKERCTGLFRHQAALAVAGSSTTNMLPWPGADSTHRRPPLASTKPLVMASPRPEPGWESSVTAPAR